MYNKEINLRKKIASVINVKVRMVPVEIGEVEECDLIRKVSIFNDHNYIKLVWTLHVFTDKVC
jgi:hypothetical protein